MDEKGRRFAPDDAVKKKKSDPDGAAQRNEKTEQKHYDRDKRLKEKNAKKVEKMLKRHQKVYADDEEYLNEDIPEETEPSDNEAADETQDAPETQEEAEAPVDEEIETPAQEHEKARKAKKLVFTRKRLVLAIIILAVLFIVVFYVFNSDKLSFHNISNFFSYGVLNQNSEERFPIDIKGESISPGNFSRVGQDICYSSDTKTQLLNNYGKSVYSIQHSFINPILVCGKNHTIVYNLGSTEYQIIGNDGKNRLGKAKDSILVADIAENGTYAIVTESGGYLSKLYVYDENDEQIYAYSFADYYITSVSLNSSGMRAVLSGVSALDGVENAALYVLDFTKDKPLNFVELEGNIIYDVSYLNDKNACAIGRAASYAINTNNGEVVTNNYDGRDLTGFDINTDTKTYTVSLSNSGNGSNCDIISYNSSGNQDYSFNVEEKIIDVSTYKGRVGLLTNSSVMLYSKDGKKRSEKELTSDPHSVVMYTGSDAYILCTGYIDAITI